MTSAECGLYSPLSDHCFEMQQCLKSTINLLRFDDCPVDLFGEVLFTSHDPLS